MKLSNIFGTNLFSAPKSQLPQDNSSQTNAVPQSQQMSQQHAVQKPEEHTDDISHITQEMYKKNYELAEKNKTLSILRKIDEIILSSVTDPQEIAHAVCKMLVSEGDFKIAAIYVLAENSILRRLALYETESSFNLRKDAHKQIYEKSDISLTFDRNILVRAVKEKSVKVTGNLFDVLADGKTITEADALEIQQTSGVNTTFVYPLITRSQAIGAMTISLSVRTEDLSDYQKDLLSRIYDVIGIAIDNALLYNQVQDSMEKLQALDKLKDEFVSLASHELRTPMTAIKSYLWMVLNGKGGEINEKQKRYLDVAYASTERLIALVNDMLNVSRIQSGRITLEKKAAKIDTVANEVLDEVLPRSQELGLQIEVLPHPQLPDVFIDANRIREVLTNLVGNSLKFTPAGGKITIGFIVKDGMVITEVADNGRGIQSEDMPKLFMRFGLIAGSYTQTQVSQGTGLGLYITKSIIEMHNGKVWAESGGRDKGAKFCFSLPIYTAKTQPEVGPLAGTGVMVIPSQLSPNTALPPVTSPQV